MIDPKELRIGNLVWYEATAHIIKELRLNRCQHVWAKMQNDQYLSGYDDLDPIELSPEWLERMGFRFNGMGYHSPNGKLYWYKNSLTINNDGRSKVINKSPRYVHQLQNLYFALTGTELIFKS